MRRFVCLLCLSVFWLAAAPLSAQDQANTPLYEELEILRHLLRTKISDGYAQASQATGRLNANVFLDFAQPNDTANWPNSFYNARVNAANALGATPDANQAMAWFLGGQPHVTFSQVPDLRTEGAYIRGQGMIITITMPHWPQQHVYKVQPAPAKPSDWEQARQQVRGESGGVLNLEVFLQAGPDLKEVLLKTLAENGKHLQHLRDNESVTVVVVFRGHGAPATVVSAKPDKDTTARLQNTPNDAKAGLKPPQTQAQADRQTLAESYLRLYDLQVKQGRLSEARRAIDQLLKLLDEETNDGDGSQKARREMLRRALQFYLTLENPSPDEVQRIRKITDELTQKPQPKVSNLELNLWEGSRPARLPSRLVITVPKKVLVQAGSGKLDLAAFEKQVQVEEINWTK